MLNNKKVFLEFRNSWKKDPICYRKPTLIYKLKIEIKPGIHPKLRHTSKRSPQTLHPLAEGGRVQKYAYFVHTRFLKKSWALFEMYFTEFVHNPPARQDQCRPIIKTADRKLNYTVIFSQAQQTLKCRSCRSRAYLQSFHSF